MVTWGEGECKGCKGGRKGAMGWKQGEVWDALQWSGRMGKECVKEIGKRVCLKLYDRCEANQ